MRKQNANNSTESAGPDKDTEGTFLGRWSRRKQRARTEHDEGAAVAPSPPEASDTDDKPPERVLTDEDMPPLDALDADSDYSGFFSPGVSERLRNAALRKFFLSPQFNIVDGLDDYAEDFTNFAKLGDIVTSDMRHQAELAEERAKKVLEDDAAAPADEADAPSINNEKAIEGDDKDTLTASAQNATGADDEEGENAISEDRSDDETLSG